MTWQVLNALYDPIAHRYANQFLQENGVAGDTPQTLRTNLEARLTAGDVHRRYNILDAAVATEYGIAAADVPAQESRGRRFLQSLNPLRAYSFFNENDNQQVTRAIAETRRQYTALNPAEAVSTTYLAPQEVGNIVDRLVESKTARAAARQIAINAGYTAALNNDGSRYFEERPVAQVDHRNDNPRLGEDRTEQPEEDDTIVGPRPSPPRVPAPVIDERPKLHALDCRSGHQNFESWEYSDVYNVARSIKPGETVKTLVRDVAILGTGFSVGAGAAALAWASYKATSALVGAGMQATMNYAQRYIEDRDASHALGATAGVWAMYGINAGKEAAQCQTVEGMGAYLATVAALVTGSEATHYVSKKTDNRFVKGTATAVSGTLDWALLALLGFGRPDGTVKQGSCGTGGSGNDTEKPSIDKIEYSTKTDLCKGDKAEFSFTASDNSDVEKVVAELYTASDAQNALHAKLLGVPSPATPLQDATVHQDGITDINIFGKDTVTGNGSFTITTPGDYKVLLTATDGNGNSTTQLVEHTYVIGNCESGPGEEPGESNPDEPPVDPVDPDEPQPPSVLEDCVKEHFSYGKDIKAVELREVYNYHNTPLKPEAGHEQGLTIDKTTWKDGSVSLNNVYDEHTPCDFNVDNTVVMLEHYTDAKTLDYRVLVDVDASGHFEIPKEFAAYKGDDIQVTWAEVTHCEDGKLGLEDLASYTHGKHVDIPKETVFSGTVPAHVSPHYVDCDGTVDVTPRHTDEPRIIPAPVGNHILDLQKTTDARHLIAYDSLGHPTQYRVVEGNYYLDTIGNIQGNADIIFPTPLVSGNYTMKIELHDLGVPPAQMDVETIQFNVSSAEQLVEQSSNSPNTQSSTTVISNEGALETSPIVTPNTVPLPEPAQDSTPTVLSGDGLLSERVDVEHYYQETYYIDDEVLRAFKRQQQAVLELQRA